MTLQVNTSEPRIEPGWRAALAAEFDDPYMSALRGFLVQERRAARPWCPPPAAIFTAFNLTPFDRVRVVIVGQDPYHGPGQAHGLSFSVPAGIAVPRSLANIFTEIESDLGIPRPAHGNLEHWARQGVLLLNATLTVGLHRAGSHHGHGWERFTDAAIRALSDHREGIVFLLWGRHAKAKATLIDASRHHVLQAAHPSPLSASKGFFGCRHFSRTNAILESQGMPSIDWSLPPAPIV